MTKRSVLLMLSGALLTNACDFARSDCWTGDFRNYSGVDEAILEVFELEWYSHARVCKMGRYLLAGPADSNSDILFVLDMKRDVAHIIIAPDSLTVFKFDGGVLAQFSKSEDGASYDSINYEGFDPASNTNVSVFDFELDGVADFRISSSEDNHTRRMEKRIGAEWHELIRREDRYGVVVDGDFLPLGEAEKRILKIRERPDKRPDG